MEYSKRYHDLKSVFQMETDYHLAETNTDIRFFNFNSGVESAKEPIVSDELKNDVPENNQFTYPVFAPANETKFDKAILLLHGLNERRWTKYLTWAEYLCSEIHKPVILFPIAYHMNRAPQWWTNPRSLFDVLDLRRKSCEDEKTISFANAALSKRLSDKPSRFYSSGRQTLNDVRTLLGQIKNGQHAIFKEDTHIDIFSYSIGSFLSQILLMSNPDNLLSDSRLFMFCGGSIFSSMDGISKNIMDRESFNKIQDYYKYSFGLEASSPWVQDKAFESFESMITPERKKSERLSFFKNLGNRLCGVSLAKDTVIPYKGVKEALGDDYTQNNVKYMDFPTTYSHENPFPVKGNNCSEVNESFLSVFRLAANHLA